MRTLALVVGVAVASAALSTTSYAGWAQTPPPAQTPVPRPFPGAGTSAPPKTTAASDPAPQSPAAPVAPLPAGLPPGVTLGAPVYPGATFLESFDGGQGQRLYVFGTNAAYADIVAYYKNVLKQSGRELFKAPAMQQFDTGKFQEDTMTFQPGVVVKDYTWNNQDGYLFVDGTKETRFKTVIQIVPPTIK